MDNHQWGHQRRLFVWGLFAVLAVVAISIIISTIYLVPRPVTSTFYPFFPFGGFFVIFWVFAIFWLLGWAFRPWGWHRYRRYWGYHNEPYEILRIRYARGEITKEQFEQMTRDLEQHSRSSQPPVQ